MRTLVIGAGNFGATAAVEMAEKKCEVLVIDTDANKLDDIKDQVGQVIVGDATDKDLLTKFAKDMDVIIVSLGEKVDASVLITHHLKELGAKRVIAKASSRDHGKILKLIGAHQVVFPEKDEAVRLVQSLISPNILDMVKLSDDVNLFEVAVPEQFIGQSINALEIRRKYGFQVLAIKNPLDGKTKVLPEPNYVFKADDIMVVIGDSDDLLRLKKGGS